MSLPDQLGVALLVGAALEAAGGDWMVGGSHATSSYGEPRSTHDVDLVSNLRVLGDELDRPTMFEWAEVAGVADLLARILREHDEA